ncbi:MAG TPA: ankyrin repeat domain-containing protein [Sedimentisphaerales bacterium]|nr:ankyrin repeat domain-containing protein [Sedimentisphaerales bacterium]
MITKRVKVINVFLLIVVFQFFFQGCSSNKPIPINVRPVSITESKDKINFNIVFAHADDLEEFSFNFKWNMSVKNYENVFVDKMLYDDDIQKERSYRYACDTAVKVAAVGNILRRNAETVFINIFNNATTLHIPGDDHFTGLIVDRQPYKEIVPPNTFGIIKLRSPEVRYYLEFKKPPGLVDKPNILTELTTEWVLEDLEGNEVWSDTIVGSGLYDHGIWDSFKTLIHNSFQPAADDHFKNLARAIEKSPEIRLYEACLQIDRDRLLAVPSSLHEILNNIQNNQERRQIANKLVYLAIEKDNVALLNELLSTSFIDVNQTDKYYQRLPIHLAVQKNNFEATKLLIANQSAVDVADSFGFTPLHYAVSNGHTIITDLLIQNGADVNVKNAEGQTPFILAVTNDHQNDWQLLLDNGVNPHAINEEDLLWTAELYNRIGLYLGEKGDKSKSTETLRIASDYFEKASKLYNRVSNKAETEAFLKDLFEFSLLVVHAWGSQWQAQQSAKQYAELKALSDAREMDLSQTQTLTLIHNYKSSALNSVATSTAGSMPMSTNVAKTTNKRDIANYYSQLSEICHEASNEIQTILECYEESGEQFKECIPVKNIQDQ